MKNKTILLVSTFSVIFIIGIILLLNTLKTNKPIERQWMSGANGWGTIIMQLYKDKTVFLKCYIFESGDSLFKGNWDYQNDSIRIIFDEPYPILTTSDITEQVSGNIFIFKIGKSYTGENQIEVNGLYLFEEPVTKNLKIPEYKSTKSPHHKYLNKRFKNEKDLLKFSKEILIDAGKSSNSYKKYIDSNPTITWNNTVKPDTTESYVLYAIIFPDKDYDKGSFTIYFLTDSNNKIAQVPTWTNSMATAKDVYDSFPSYLKSYWFMDEEVY